MKQHEFCTDKDHVLVYSLVELMFCVVMAFERLCLHDGMLACNGKCQLANLSSRTTGQWYCPGE